METTVMPTTRAPPRVCLKSINSTPRNLGQPSVSLCAQGGSDLVEPLSIGVQQSRLVRGIQTGVRSNLAIGVDLLDIRCEEQIHGPIAPEDDPVNAERLDRVKNPRAQAFNGPMSVEHPEARHFACNVWKFREG